MWGQRSVTSFSTCGCVEDRILSERMMFAIWVHAQATAVSPVKCGSPVVLEWNYEAFDVSFYCVQQHLHWSKIVLCSWMLTFWIQTAQLLQLSSNKETNLYITCPQMLYSLFIYFTFTCFIISRYHYRCINRKITCISLHSILCLCVHTCSGLGGGVSSETMATTIAVSPQSRMAKWR